MSDIEWTNSAVTSLIKEYEKKRELWDSTHEMYRVQNAKYEAWSDLARMFNCDIADLRKKFNSIFASHRREKAKIRSGNKSTWFLYPYMNFLPSHLDNIDTDGVETIEEATEERLETSEDDDGFYQEEQVMIKQEPMIETYSKPARRTLQRQHKQHGVTKTVIKKRNIREMLSSQLDSKLLETLKLLKKSELSKKKDECDTFGEYIAMSLRKHDERSQAMIKQAINNILFEQEMKKYNSGQYTVIIQGVEENPLVTSDEHEK